MKKFYYVTALALLAVASMMAANAGKVEILHRTSKGDFVLISVSANAVDAHLAHGDELANPECE